MMYHILRGRPLWIQTEEGEGEGEGEGKGEEKDNIIFFRRTIHLLKIQVALNPMSMDLTHT
jgi:hypothetical protein